MKLTPLQCRSCASPLDATEVSIEAGIVRCQHCNAVYALEPSAPTSESTKSTGREFIDKPRVAMPRGFLVEDSGRTLFIRRKWFSGAHIFLAFFATLWNGFLLFWFTMALGAGAGLFALFGLLHLGVGIFLAYSAVAGFINETRIAVDPHRLSVRHGPLPWAGNTTMEIRGAKQLFAKERRKSGKHGPSFRYDVYAITEKGRRRKIIKNLQSVDQAVFIEQRIEKFLGLDDRPVRGEAS